MRLVAGSRAIARAEILTSAGAVRQASSGELGPVKLTGGAGYFELKTKGDTTYFGDPADSGDFFGNTAVEVGTGQACGTNAGTTCVYLYDYKLIEIFGAVDFDIASIPVVVFFDATQNSDPDKEDTSWKAGTRRRQDEGHQSVAVLLLVCREGSRCTVRSADRLRLGRWRYRQQGSLLQVGSRD